MSNKEDLNTIGRLNKKIMDQAKTIKELREELAGLDQAAQQLSAAVDSILCEAARTFGENVDEKEYTLRLPLVSVRRALRDYTVSTDVSEENDAYVVTVRRREASDEG